MHKSSTRMHRMVLTLDIRQNSAPTLGSGQFWDHAGVQLNFCSMFPYRHLVGTWSAAWDMAGSIRINVLQLLHHSADAPQLRKGTGGLQTALFLLDSVCISKVDIRKRAGQNLTAANSWYTHGAVQLWYHIDTVHVWSSASWGRQALSLGTSGWKCLR